MNRIFADACFWIALINRRDDLFEKAVAAQKDLAHTQVVTTDEVLSEVLNHLCHYGSTLRQLASKIVDDIRADTHVLVIEQSRATFDAGFALYKNRVDKEYSLVDCVSFELMKQESISEALTNDHHFEQEGFVALFRL
jgi:uncharacterized protein